MSDDIFKRAEELREKNHPHNADNAASQKAQGNKFYHDNLPHVRKMLVELGELWKSQEPNRPGLLGIGGHPGNDYYVYSDTTFENKLALYLFDKSNIQQKAFFTGMSVNHNIQTPGESLRVEFGVDHFDLHLPYVADKPDRHWMDYSPKKVQTLDDLKSVIAEL